MGRVLSRPAIDIVGPPDAAVSGARRERPKAGFVAWALELRATAALSGPMIVTSIAQMAINATTIMMVGRLGADKLVATALANGIYNSFMVFGMGLVSAVAPMMANERGRHPHAVRELRRTVRQGLWAAIAIALPLWLVLWQTEAVLVWLGQDPEGSRQAGLLMHYLQWGLLPQLFYMVLRSFLAVLERPLWTLLAAVAAILVNLGLGSCIIFGHLGAPALGLVGAGIANACAAATLFLGLVLVVTLDRRFRRYRLFGRVWRADWPRFGELMRLGLPIAVTVAFETTIFSAAMIMMGLISTVAVGAHAIALQIASLCYMVPLGIAQATTVRVGLARGAGNADAIRRAGWTGFGLAVGASALAALVVAAAPRLLVGIFVDLGNPLNDPVVALAMSLLRFAALFLIADCLQVVGAGMLRGLGDARMPMLIAGIGYWIIGLPLGALLAFDFGIGAAGIWIGLAAGLGAVGVLMTVRWAMRERLGLLG